MEKWTSMFFIVQKSLRGGGGRHGSGICDDGGFGKVRGNELISLLFMRELAMYVGCGLAFGCSGADDFV